MAQVSGTLSVAGIAASVRIVRDTWGVPHIYAGNQRDLFFAQGFVQAQDRLFQMDLWRRSAQGRLSEVLGPNFIERDAMTRRIQYRGDIAEEWASYGPDVKAIVEAFVRGINAWVELARERPPEEFRLAGWKPEAWRAQDLLNRAEAFVSSGDALDEVFRARLIATVGLDRARVLLPEARLDPVPGFDTPVIPGLVGEMIRRVGTPPFFLGLAAPMTDGTVRLQPGMNRLGAVRNLPHRINDVGLQPDRLETLDNPSPRYLVHLIAPGWNVIGATAPWRPGVAEGHNARVGWTTTPLDTDAQDVYVEKLNPSNPRQVEEGGRWVDIESRTGFIAVRGRKTPVDFTTDITPRGLIVASDLERHLAFAIRWSGSAPGFAAELAASALDRSHTAAELDAARIWWKAPARTFSVVEAGGSGASPERSSDAKNAKARAALALYASLREHPDREDALLQTLAASASRADALMAQRAAIVNALADALRERMLPEAGPVLFAHPLAVNEAARRRFNIVTQRPPGVRDPFAMTLDGADWDRSTAIIAPGQSESPESAHYADLAALWSTGARVPLAFSEGAVQQHTAATLTLTPR